MKDWDIPYVRAFNLDLQTSPGDNWMLDVSYVGDAGRKHENHVPDHDHWIYGQQHLPGARRRVLRAVILKRKEGVSISASLATIIVERIFDGVVMLGFILR